LGQSIFDKDANTPRQNLELRCQEQVAAFVDGLDEWTVEYLSAHSERLFRKALTLAQVKDMYHPTLCQAVGYDPLLRPMPGSRGECRLWTASHMRRGTPVDWHDTELTVQLHTSHMRLMGGKCGSW
jgi:hypothetical protein